MFIIYIICENIVMNINRNVKKIYKDNRIFLELAVRCALIDEKQQKTISSLLIKREQEDPESSILSIMIEQKILLQDDIDFLRAIKKHLDIQFLDNKFTQLALVNNFTNKEGIEKAQNLQVQLFKEKRESKNIADILVESKEITEADRTAVMLTQDRIDDEDLASAINLLGKTELEKRAINKTFGVIVVKNYLATISEVNQAISIQKKEIASGKEKRYLGQILKDLINLKDEEILSVLKEQKIIEKKRLNLKKALKKLNIKNKKHQDLINIFEEFISKDKLEASVWIKDNSHKKITVADLKNWLKIIGINFGIVPDNEIEKFIKKGIKEVKFVIAKGVPPEKAIDGSIEFFFNTANSLDDNHINFKTIPIVKKGTLLSEITPSKNGKPGKNVFGKTIIPPKPKSFFLGCGKGVYEENRIKFYAAIDGYPMLYKNRTLFITPPFDRPQIQIISGDIDSETKDINEACNVEVRGMIKAGADVRCQQLLVMGDILGKVRTMGNIDVKGGIGQRADSKQKSNENTNEKNDENKDVFTSVNAIGNIVVRKDVFQAHIITNGFFQATNSDILASDISAKGDIIIKNVLYSKTCPTVFKLGLHCNHWLTEIEEAIRIKSENLKKIVYNYELEKLEHRIYDQAIVQDKGYKTTKADISAENELSNIKKQGNIKTESDDKSSEIIKRLEQEIENLIIEKSTFLLNEKNRVVYHESVLRVKKQIPKGTVIEGLNATRVLKKTMYGVKFSEEKDPDTQEWSITINGYYD